MIILECAQHSPEWFMARLGIPTASQFHRIVSSKTLKPLAGSEGYMHELLSEWLIGIPSSFEGRGYVERGNGLEASARDWYELNSDRDTKRVGVCLSDDRMKACSPDSLVGDDGGLEIKVPSAKVHVANLLGMTDEHFAQVQGNLWITGRVWWDLLSYHPELPPALVRIPRNEEYIAALDSAMSGFLTRLTEARASLRKQGAIHATALAPEFVAALETNTNTEGT